MKVHAESEDGGRGGRSGLDGRARHSASSAQPHGPAAGEHRGMHGGFAGLGQLGLSDEQRQDVRAIMELHKAERQAIGQRLRDARRAQAEAVMAVPVDEAAVRARSAELAKVEADAAVLRARVHAEVYNVLTPEQQEKAKALRAEREQRREQWKSERPAPRPNVAAR